MRYECPIPLLAQTTDYESRYISRLPSPEMQRIAAVEPAIFQEERGRLCIALPTNFIGSLLIHAYQNRFMEPFALNDLLPPEHITTPIEVIPNTFLFHYSPQDKRHVPLSMETGPVLLKYACGNVAGVVTRGPLAGLLLDTVNSTSPTQGMCINRVFNDTPVNIKDLPYNPMSARADYLTEWEKNAQLCIILHHLLMETTREVYQQYVEETERVKGKTTTIDAFFDLSAKAGIDIDTETFHFTRPLPDSGSA